MPYAGSVNQIESSDFTTRSFGELKRLPFHLSARTVIEPLISVRVTRRVRCSQVTSRPWLSTLLPLELLERSRNTETWSEGSTSRIMRLFGMSDQTRWRPAANQAGPSDQRVPVHNRSTRTCPAKHDLKRGSRTSMPVPST